MHRHWTSIILLAAGILAAAQTGWSFTNVYTWVKDKQAGSERSLKESQTMRVIDLPESQALGLVRQVLTDDLAMVLADYHATKHMQDAETTPASVLPEEITRTQDADELADEDYRFILQVRLKTFGKRTRIYAKAFPMYRVHDTDAEAEANPGSDGAGIEVKVKTRPGEAVGIGPMFVLPVDGIPADFNLPTLPEASRWSNQLVRSFLFFLDKRAQAAKGASGDAGAGEPKGAEVTR